METDATDYSAAILSSELKYSYYWLVLKSPECRRLWNPSFSGRGPRFRNFKVGEYDQMFTSDFQINERSQDGRLKCPFNSHFHQNACWVWLCTVTFIAWKNVWCLNPVDVLKEKSTLKPRCRNLSVSEPWCPLELLLHIFWPLGGTNTEKYEHSFWPPDEVQCSPFSLCVWSPPPPDVAL